MRRLAVLAIVPFVFVACGSDSNTSTTSVDGEPAGTKTYTDLSENHVDTPVDYPQNPPVGGAPSQAWQDCQCYDTSIPNERGVHSLEHGAVWITYSPDTSKADHQLLRDLAATGDHILVSQYDGLPSPVVASAWGKQLLLHSVADPELQQFVGVFQSGPQAPEPGVTCRNSTTETT